jgi:hypothetical protein
LNTTIDWSMTDFTDPIASLGEVGGAIRVCAEAEPANTNKISAPSATERRLNFNRAILSKNNEENFLVLEGGSVLEKLAIILVTIRRPSQATLREPSIRHRIRQRDAAGVNRPRPAVDRSLIEYPAATPAGKGEPRTASGSNRFDGADFPVVRSPRRQTFLAHINS